MYLTIFSGDVCYHQTTPGAVAVWWQDGVDDLVYASAPDCFGWWQDGVLYLPADGQTATYNVFHVDTGLPDERGNWYRAYDGAPCLIGLTGAPLSVLVGN